jgi:hypothetical protein
VRSEFVYNDSTYTNLNDPAGLQVESSLRGFPEREEKGTLNNIDAESEYESGDGSLRVGRVRPYGVGKCSQKNVPFCRVCEQHLGKRRPATVDLTP